MAMVYGRIPTPVNVLLDIDDTLYHHPKYRALGGKAEVAAVARFLRCSIEEAETRIRSQKKYIWRITGVEATLTQTVCAFGMPADEWNRIRCGIWKPSQWLSRDSELCQAIDMLVSHPRIHHVVCGTNSPLAVGIETVATLGLPDTLLVFGPESFSCSKPNQGFFCGIVQAMHSDMSNWISIGDREISDCNPALAAGFAGAILIQGRDDLVKTIHILRRVNMKHNTLTGMILSHLVPGEIRIVGVTGQAGAGKTSHIAPMIQGVAAAKNYWAATLPLDAFFKMSSEERAQWLAEGEALGEEEAARRRDQMTWWDFQKAEDVLASLREGKPIQLMDVYNRADKGRLTGTITLAPEERGGLLIFEGVAVAHLAALQAALYVHAPARVRRERLLERDKHRGQEEAQKRFALTEAFEQRYFHHHWKYIDFCVDNGRIDGILPGDLPVFPRPESFEFA